MNPRNKFFRRIAMLGVLSVGVAACEGDTITIPDPLPTISAAPAEIRLNPGQTQNIVASTSLTGGVTFTSLATGVATVSATGVVTAVAPGNATIQVSATAQPTLSTAVNVIVASPVLPPTDSAEVLIQSITTSGTIFPVDPDSVVGQIDITMAVERGNADMIRVLVNNTVVNACSQTFAPSGAITAADLSVGAVVQEVVCSLDTRAFVRGTGADANRGIPTYPNGNLVVRVELRRAGTVLDFAQTGTFTLRNSDYMQALVASLVTGTSTVRPSVIGDNGLQWFGNGDLQFTLIPVIYSGATTTASGYPAQATISIDGYVGGNEVTTSRTVTTLTNGGFVVTFPRNTSTSTGGVLSFNTGREGSRINAVSTTVGGQPGPATAYGPFTGNPLPSNRVFFSELQSGTALLNSILRWDNESPEAGRLILVPHPAVPRVWARNGWVNGAVNLFSGKDGQHDSPFDDDGFALGPIGTNASSAFPSIPSAPPSDAVYGVGLDSTRIFALRVANTASQPAAATVVTTGMRLTPSEAIGTQLTETLTNNEYVVAARTWDRLGNFSDVVLTRADLLTGGAVEASQTGNRNRIGVDIQNAGISIVDSIGVPNGYPYNPTDTYSVQVVDTSAAPITAGPSGIALTRVTRVTYSCPALQRQCAPATGVDVELASSVGTVPSSGTSWITHAIGATVEAFSRELFQITTEAYHRLDGRVWDRAGNLTGPLSSTDFIRDSMDPLVSNVRLETVNQFFGGQNNVYEARVTDNVDMRRASAGFDFADLRLPFQIVPITTFGPSAVVLDTLLVQSMPFVRTLSRMIDTMSVNPPEVPNAARFRAWDHSSPLGRFSTQANNIVSNTLDPLRRNWFQGEATLSGGATYGINRTDWESGPVRWVVRGQTGTFTNPFVRVLFYLRLTDVVDTNGLPVNYLLGQSTNVSVQDIGADPDGRIWRYQIPVNPGIFADQTYEIFAVGVTASGDALLSTMGPGHLVGNPEPF